MEMALTKQGAMVTARSDELTPMQKKYVLAFVNDGKGCLAAAISAGCENPRTQAYDLFRNSKVFTAIHYEMYRANAEACVKGEKCLSAIVARPAETAADRAVQVQAVKALQVRGDSLARVFERSKAAKAGSLADVDPAELRRVIADMKDMKAREAGVIDVTPETD